MVLRFSFRSNEWASQCNRKDLLHKEVMFRYQNMRVCAKHFEAGSFLNDTRTQLCRDALPTLNIVKETNTTAGEKRKLHATNDSESDKVKGW